MKNILHIGIDIGSTTVKIAVLNDAKQCLHACYVRHYTDIRQKVWDLLQNAYEIFGDQQITIAITGSGGIALADYLGIAFVQEVIAGTKAVRTYYSSRKSSPARRPSAPMTPSRTALSSWAAKTRRVPF